MEEKKTWAADELRRIADDIEAKGSSVSEFSIETPVEKITDDEYPKLRYTGEVIIRMKVENQDKEPETANVTESV